MSGSFPHRAMLLAHPTTQNEAVRSIEAEVTLGSTVLDLRFVLHADMSRIRTVSQSAGSAGRVAGLWRHTCFEAFVSSGAGTAYVELNFSPARQWAAYQFDSYRDGMKPLALAQPPQISTHTSPHQLELSARLQLPEDAIACAAQRPKLALTAVIEDESGSLSYWSVRHPAGGPDFHHPESFFGLSP
jgi:hypothetical protein